MRRLAKWSAALAALVLAGILIYAKVRPNWSWATVLSNLRTGFWDLELIRLEQGPLTVGEVFQSILLVVFGIVAARLSSAVLARWLHGRFRLSDNAVSVIRSLAFYFLILCFVLLGLRIVQVPLTIFTLLGGAAAIGIGFGSQTFVSNFISGLIILAEQPIRVGDLVEVDDLYCTVEHIGPRSTRVRTSDNMEIIVPNSEFLQKNVVNWTLSDDRFRTSISVGVAYGSPTKKVRELLLRAAEEDTRVFREPEPMVLFTDFADNALQFEIHFWIRMRRMMDRRRTESDLRFRIDELFREAAVVIAFPQRDVHLEARRAIEVKLVDPSPKT